ncbi:MAG: helix-turn-helix transcriptional regulator [Candidatus Zambryskibacteria bacterium]|nr:helix-turn-helix transcriptional regulator [Candidatus Zambryskibacteria bacterium]
MTLEELKPLISKEIRKRRLYFGLTHQAMANKIGVTKPAWVQYETTNAPIQLGTLLNVCRGLECSLLDFFNSIFGIKKYPEEELENEIKEVVSSALDKAGVSAEVNIILRMVRQ